MTKLTAENKWAETVAREREYIAAHPHIDDIHGAQELMDEALVLIDNDTRPVEFLPRGSKTNKEICQLALRAIGETDGKIKKRLLGELRSAVAYRKRPPDSALGLSLSDPSDDIFEDLDTRVPEGRHSSPRRTSDDTSRSAQGLYES